MYRHSHSPRTTLLALVKSMCAQTVDMGLVSHAELDELDAARSHLDEPHTNVLTGYLFLAWGGKPT